MRRSLRLRVLLFFAAFAASALALFGGALALGAQQDAGGFVLAFVTGGFGLLFLSALFWWLFDQNVALPVERIADDLRVRAHGGGASSAGSATDARHLGDLGPAADAVARALGDTAVRTAETVAAETRRLAEDRTRLTALLTEIPVATILVDSGDRIVLYDGQAAKLLSRRAPPRLGAPMSDYFDAGELAALRRRVQSTGLGAGATLRGDADSERLSVRARPMADGGYLLVLDPPATETGGESMETGVVYDFALPARPDVAPGPDAPLRALTYCVFDTETTGLLPHRDEVVEIGAVRVMDGKPVAGERFETFVNPGRPIPEAARRVHGICDRDVSGAPGIAEAGRAFHAFAAGSVIVAHNAPFDMAFLRKHAATMGVEWTQPILDTVLLSAILFGTTADHRLDAIAARLGVDETDIRRHSATGDAILTARSLARMLPMLEGRGISTFGALLAETRRHGRLVPDLNAETPSPD
ncbi:3'-5' exonuclease [Roseivivax marinus]|uniref:3'-5' exonuclease n=1 Tax=Roseivivax marinus TaxID=1379903 RepID=UPI001F03FF4C|nr:3'-5' exonuclease [Roseivivax marinus]UMA66328.1 3'-5' exonuclease [Roseivivax marinus]